MLRRLTRKIRSARVDVGGPPRCGTPLHSIGGCARAPAGRSAPRPRPRGRAARRARSPPPRRERQSCIDRPLTGAARGRAAVGDAARARAWSPRGCRRTRATGTWPSSRRPRASEWPARRSGAPTRSPRASRPAGEELIVQACRRLRRGRERPAHRGVARQCPSARPRTVSLVKVSTPSAARKDELDSLGPRPHRARWARLRRGGAARRRRRPPAARGTSSPSSRDRRPRRPQRPRQRRRPPLRASRSSAVGAAQRPRGRLSQARRLQQRDEEAGGRQSRASSSRSRCRSRRSTGLQRPGHRDHHRRAAPRRQAGVPADGRPPRPRVAVGRARDGVGLRAGQRLQGRQRARAPPDGRRPHDRRPDRQPRGLQHLARGGQRHERRPRRARRDAPTSCSPTSTTARTAA